MRGLVSTFHNGSVDLFYIPRKGGSLTVKSEEMKKLFEDHGALIADDHFVLALKDEGDEREAQWFHTADYVDKNVLLALPFEVMNPFGKALAEQFWDAGIEAVVGPSQGGIVLAQWTAYWCTTFLHRFTMRSLSDCTVYAVWADEEDVFGWKLYAGSATGAKFVAHGRVEFDYAPPVMPMVRIGYQTKMNTRRVLGRGYNRLVAGKRCLIVDDVVTTGTTLKKVRAAVELAGGIPKGAATLCDRSSGKVTAATLNVEKFTALLKEDLAPLYPADQCPICKERGLQSIRIDLGHGKEFLMSKSQ